MLQIASRDGSVCLGLWPVDAPSVQLKVPPGHGRSTNGYRRNNGSPRSPRRQGLGARRRLAIGDITATLRQTRPDDFHSSKWPSTPRLKDA